MLLKLSQLANIGTIDKVIFNSIDVSLYQVSIELNDEEMYITNEKGAFLRAFNTLELQKIFRSFPYQKMVIRHCSAYDEMVGLPEDTDSQRNMLEIEIKDNDLS